MGAASRARKRGKTLPRSEQKIRGFSQKDVEVRDAHLDDRMGRSRGKIRGIRHSAQIYSESGSDFVRAMVLSDDGLFGTDIAGIHADRKDEMEESEATVATTAATSAQTTAAAAVVKAPVKVAFNVTMLPKSIRSLLAGGISGAVSKTATSPLECVRMKVMVGKGGGGVFHVAKDIFATAGMGGFFKGNGADVIRTVPSKAIQLAAFDTYKRILSKKNKETGKLECSPLMTTVSGAVAGVTSTIVCFPLEVLRTRLACGDQYTGLMNAVMTIFKDEGIKAFYSGVGPSVMGVIPYAGFNLAAYDSMKKAYLLTNKVEAVPHGWSLIFGAVAGVSAATVTFPLEVVRRRMMMGSKYKGTIDALVRITKEEGGGVLFKGCTLNWVKLAPSAGISFYVYEVAKEWLQVSKKK
mmetsp:Transcript_19727/g.62746  ORF Transcript_19727/g.62746 Transcript_19727/m.62746 type:complete len:409 (+) Transcript_19727:263-1489(+)